MKTKQISVLVVGLLMTTAAFASTQKIKTTKCELDEDGYWFECTDGDTSVDIGPYTAKFLCELGRSAVRAGVGCVAGDDDASILAE